MAKKKVEPKQRAEKYDTKLAINGTFEGVIKASFLGKPAVKKEK
ncbi:hypothetical protein [Mucilaginibacter flavidus]|nr:hypothetical protein [Mucilaginibacter flavidus]